MKRAGVSSEQAVVDGFFGNVVVTVEDEAVCAVRIVQKEAAGEELPAGDGNIRSPVLRSAVAQLRRYLSGEGRSFDLPLRLAGTPFQQAVWREAAAIPYGASRTYGQIATRLGRPRAARAVGQALSRNPVPLFIPCHRIVAGNGGMGGYTPDPSIKRALLKHEGVADFG